MVVAQEKEGVVQCLIHEKVLSVTLNCKDGEFNCGAFCHQLVTIQFSLTDVLGWWIVAVNFAGGIAWGGRFLSQD
ncbi:MAG: hypothetical protein EBS60_09065 [Verrucomicrobia bacterium]|nr:hypothetical protein [Verrucomicrobiota bacterium]